MKKILAYMAGALLTLSACEVVTDPKFDEQSSIRLDEAIAEAQASLIAAPNGWLMEYYPNNAQIYGGFNLHFRFIDRDSVAISSDIDPNVSAKSLYQMGRDRGPTLNFNLYNTVLHYFSDPSINVAGGIAKSYEGDYEFVIEKITPEEIVLMGKKTRNVIRMRPFDYDGTWKEYCAEISDQEYTSSPVKMVVGGVESVNMTKSAWGIRYSASFPGSPEYGLPFIAVPGGMKLYEPVTINGQTIENFELNTENNTLICTDPGTDAIIYLMPSYDDYAGTYIMNYTNTPPVSNVRNRSAEIRLIPIGDYKYHVEGILKPEDEERSSIVMNFDPAAGILKFLGGQKLFQRAPDDVWVCFFVCAVHSSGSSTTNLTATYGLNMTGLVLDESNMPVSFTFVDNGLYTSYTVTGFNFYGRNAADNAWVAPGGTMTGVNGDATYTNMQFVKQ